MLLQHLHHGKIDSIGADDRKMMRCLSADPSPVTNS